MSARSPKKRSKPARAKTRSPQRGKAVKAKRPAKKRKRAAKKRAAKKRNRSSAAKRGWEKRRKRKKLIDAMHDQGWTDVSETLAFATKDELYDHLKYIADLMGIELSDVYRMYFGYGVPGVGAV